MNAVRNLLEAGASLSQRNHIGHSALHNAVETSQLDIAETLLKAGANPDEEDSSRETPLIHAIHVANDVARQLEQQASVAMMVLLLTYGADPNRLSSTSITRYGRSPLQAAGFWGNDEMTEILKRAGAHD